MIKNYYGINIYEPDYNLFDTLNIQSRFFEKFDQGRYISKKDINNIANELFLLYNDRLNSLIKEYGGFELLEICFAQYNSANLIQKKLGNVTLGVEDAISRKQMYKYIIELIIKKNYILYDINTNERSVNEIFCLTNEVFYWTNLIGGLKYGEIYGTITLVKNNKNGTTFCNYTPSKKEVDINKGIKEKFIKSQELHHQIYGKEFGKYDKNFQKGFLNEIFKKQLGYSYEEYLNIICSFRHEDSLKTLPKTKMDLFYIEEEDLIKIIKENINLKREQIIQLLESITLTNNNIQSREIYNPDNPYRFYSRFICKFKYQGKDIFFWDKLMAKEGRGLLIGNFMSGNTPPELGENIKKIVNKMGFEYTKKFETYIGNKLKTLGYQGKSRNDGKKLYSKGKITLPSKGVGEIDWIGVNPTLNKIIILELKTNKLAAVPIQQNNEVEKFQAYGIKFQHKINWINKNLNTISKDLETMYGIELNNPQIEPIMVTEYPTIYSLLKNGFKVIDFSIFLDELNKAT